MDKYSECIDCADGIEKPTIAGRCKAYHYSIYRKKLILEKQKEKSKVRSLINSKPNKELLVKNDKIVDNDLELWFLHRMHTCVPICENCNTAALFLTEEKYKKLWRSCQAHLLPKRHFKSISHHPLIGMVLGSGYSGMCFCHDNYDRGWSYAEKMNIWPEVVRRFQILYPLISENEHRFIPKQLLDTL